MAMLKLLTLNLPEIPQDCFRETFILHDPICVMVARDF